MLFVTEVAYVNKTLPGDPADFANTGFEQLLNKFFNESTRGLSFDDEFMMKTIMMVT